MIGIGQLFTNIFLELFWFIFVKGPLYLLSKIFFILQQIGGGLVIHLLYGQKTVKLDHVPPAFIGFVIFAFILWALVFAINFVVTWIKKGEQYKENFVASIKNSFIFVALVLVIPGIFLLFSFLIEGIDKLLPIITGLNLKHTNLADYIYYVGSNKKITAQTVNPPSDYSAPGYFDIQNWNPLITSIVAIILDVILALAVITLIIKVLDLFLLFVISPVVALSIIFDNGKRILLWKDLVLAKFLSMTALLLTYLLFPWLLISISTILTSGGSVVINTFIYGFVAIALAIGMRGFANIVSSFVGEGIGVQDTLSSLGQLWRSGLALRTGAGVLKTAAIGTIGAASTVIGGRRLTNWLFNKKRKGGGSGSASDDGSSFRKKVGSIFMKARQNPEGVYEPQRYKGEGIIGLVKRATINPYNSKFSADVLQNLKARHILNKDWLRSSREAIKKRKEANKDLHNIAKDANIHIDHAKKIQDDFQLEKRISKFRDKFNEHQRKKENDKK